MARKRSPRINDRILEGLQEIYAYMGTEHEAGQLSSIECRCDGCQAADDCQCAGKTYGKMCEQCRAREDIGLALGWLGQMINDYQSKRKS